MTVSHPPFAPRRAAGPATWWGKAWQRGVEEAAYAEADLRRGRALARAGAVGSIAVRAGGYVAAVVEREDAFTVSGQVEPLDATSRQLLVEVLAGGVGRMAALLAGDLPMPLVEACEEVGVELLPYVGELGWSCSCEEWADPCPHALAVATQVGWLVQRDPLVLLHLRGLPREELLAEVHAVGAAPAGSAVAADGNPREAGESPAGEPDEALEADLETGLDAAERAARLLGESS